MPGGEGGEPLRLFHGGVVFPQPGQRVGVLLELGLEGERHAGGVHRQRRAARGVYTDADDLSGGERRVGARLGQGGGDAGFQALVIVQGVLARDVGVAPVGDDALVAAPVVVHGGGHFPAGVDLHHQGAHRIGAVVYSYRVLLSGQWGILPRRCSFDAYFKMIAPDAQGVGSG